MIYSRVLHLAQGVRTYQGRPITHAVLINDGWLELVNWQCILIPGEIYAVAVLELSDAWVAEYVQLPSDVQAIADRILAYKAQPEKCWVQRWAEKEYRAQAAVEGDKTACVESPAIRESVSVGSFWG